ncbi:glycosyltransferase family 4 protein [uncultured Aeromicrobium sp.]|uniref:glycosyltransferase family 4 protein n=1 Tax=uncultured Aeromicrobium sp. TaxID=337820 RepID=UPI0025FDFEE3|nr:glycosyltransferase family 4 protein [uncultured Aeromicrobium sp.]
MKQVNVVFPSNRRVRDWATQHEQGQRPGRWPYGLDQLAVHIPQAELGFEQCQPLTLTGAVRALLPRHRGREIAVVWDEWTAMRVLQERERRQVYAGVIWATDRGDSVKESLKSRLILASLRHATGLWCLSEPQVGMLQKRLGSHGPRVSYLRFGIDANFFSPRPYPDEPLVVSVGGDRDRDATTLFRALSIVHRARPDAKIIAQTSSRLTPPDGVEVLPKLSHVELRELYARASVVTIATRPNVHASGMTVSLESMATGRPVIITSSPGLEDYVANEKTGHLVGTGDHRAMADRIVALLNDPSRSAEMGRAGRAKVEALHTTDHMMHALARIIDGAGQ